MEVENNLAMQELDRREELILVGCDWGAEGHYEGCYLGEEPGPG